MTIGLSAIRNIHGRQNEFQAMRASGGSVTNGEVKMLIRTKVALAIGMIFGAASAAVAMEAAGATRHVGSTIERQVPAGAYARYINRDFSGWPTEYRADRRGDRQLQQRF